ncbi:hypothetical protein [Brevibacterium aurantiacum]|uniref:hypothetical protein n=1 Tax=Brevibacterium aurantiacum TaxID=273384 RepID=UPI0011C04782|nr:hypothetical protein [Brevibacterium aurantiacum]
MQVMPIDSTRLGSITFVSSEPDAVFGTGEQKERNGLPVWAVETLIRPEEGRSSVEVVKVAAPSSPGFEPLTPLNFDSLIARHWENNGRTGISLSADGVNAAGNPPRQSRAAEKSE